MKKRALFTVLTASLMCAAAAVAFAACGDEEAKTYSVTYAKSTLNETGAVPTDTAKYEEGAEVTVKGKGELALTDYTFSGWVYDGKTYTEGAKLTMPAKDVTLTAKWAPVPATKYTVTFAANVDDDGLTLPEALQVEAGTVIDLADYPIALNGYRFVSWSDGTNTYAADGKLTVTGNVTLTATLREEAFSETVTLSYTNDENDTNDDVDLMGYWYKEVEVTGTEGAYYTLIFEGENNPFAAYLSQEDFDAMEGLVEPDTSKLFKMPEGGKLTLYVVGYEELQPETGKDSTLSGVISVLKGGSGTVTFLFDENYPGRPIDNVVSSVEIEAGGKVSELPAAPEYEEGYVFEGWYYVTLDTSMGRPRPVYVPFTADTIIESDLEVYAKWTYVAYSNGLTGDDAETVVLTKTDLGDKTADKYTITLGDASVFESSAQLGYITGWSVNGTPYAFGASLEVNAGERVTITPVYLVVDAADGEISAAEGTLAWTDTIAKGQVVTLTGTMTSKGEANNAKTVWAYVYSGATPTDWFRIDWFHGGVSETGCTVTNDIGPTWGPEGTTGDFSIFQTSIKDADVTIKFDFTYANKIVVRFDVIGKANPEVHQTMQYTITNANDFANEMKIGLGGWASCTKIMTFDRHTHNYVNDLCECGQTNPVHTVHNWSNGVCTICKAICAHVGADATCSVCGATFAKSTLTVDNTNWWGSATSSDKTVDLAVGETLMFTAQYSNFTAAEWAGAIITIRNGATLAHQIRYIDGWEPASNNYTVAEGTTMVHNTHDNTTLPESRLQVLVFVNAEGTMRIVCNKYAKDDANMETIVATRIMEITGVSLDNLKIGISNADGSAFTEDTVNVTKATFTA